MVIADAAHTRRHGTFLSDSAQEAESLNCRERTVSLWSEVNANRGTFMNSRYRRKEGMLHAKLEQAELQLWTQFYSRYCLPPCVFLRHRRMPEGLKHVHCHALSSPFDCVYGILCSSKSYLLGALACLGHV